MKKITAITFTLLCALLAFAQTRRIAQLSHSADALELSPALTDNFGLGPSVLVLDSFVKVSDTMVIEYVRYRMAPIMGELEADTFIHPPHLNNTAAFIDSVIAKPDGEFRAANTNLKFQGFDRKGVKVLKPSGELNWRKVSKEHNRKMKQNNELILLTGPGGGPGAPGAGLLAFWLSLTCAGLAYTIWAFQSSKIQPAA